MLYARQLGISHFGWYYVAVGVTSALGRPLLGRLSDKLGAGRSLVIAFALESGALLLMPLATHLPGLVLCGALWYTGAAIGGARTMALAIAQAPLERRGRAMASYSTALPLSNGVGALISGIVVDWAGYRWMYTVAGLLCCGRFHSDLEAMGEVEVSRIEMRKPGLTTKARRTRSWEILILTVVLSFVVKNFLVA